MAELDELNSPADPAEPPRKVACLMLATDSSVEVEPERSHGEFNSRQQSTVTGASYREVNSKVATAPKLKVEDKDRVNNSRRIKTVKLNIVKLKASLNKFSRGKVGYRSRMPNA